MSAWYYQLERNTVIDSAGDVLTEVLFTASRGVLETQLSSVLGPRHGYAEDVLEFAWVETIQHDQNRLEDYRPPYLEVREGTTWRRDGAAWRMPLIPDVSVRRGDRGFDVRVDYDRLLEAARRKGARKLRPFACAGDEFRTLAELADAGFVAELCAHGGDVVVQLDTQRLLEAVPQLSPPLRHKPLVFAGLAHPGLQDEWPHSLVGQAMGPDWDGRIPLDTWFQLDSLQQLCDDAGIDLELR